VTTFYKYPEPTPSRGARREALHEKIGNAQATLRHAASAAVIQNDPLSEQLRAVAISIGALAGIFDASEDTHFEIVLPEVFITRTWPRACGSAIEGPAGIQVWRPAYRTR
jgi:hypothetical protein